MNLDDVPEVAATPLLWREQFRALGQAARGLFLRLTRREPRHYLVMEGHVLARFTSEADCAQFTAWVGQTHAQAFRFGFERGTVAPVTPPDAGPAGSD